MAVKVNANIPGKYLVYRDLPLVREGNMIYYGDMRDKYVLCLMILSYKTVPTQEPGKTVEIPDTVFGQIWSTDTTLSDTERMVRQFDKKGLAEAFDFGISQLERYNRKK